MISPLREIAACSSLPSLHRAGPPFLLIFDPTRLRVFSYNHVTTAGAFLNWESAAYLFGIWLACFKIEVYLEREAPRQ
jgi:hypothetical protein